MMSPGPSFGSEELEFSGKLSAEAGGFQLPGGGIQPFQYSRLLLECREDFDASLSLDLGGEADWQTSAGLPPAWPVYPEQNLLSLGTQDVTDSGGTNDLNFRLNRAFLKWVSGPLEVTAGLQAFSWGSASFFRPTDYFFPLPPLVWTRDHPLGSEALNASCFLFDDLSVEGTARWLQGGDTEWVTRLVEKGIALKIVPSFARTRDRDGLGLETTVTFPDLQARLEGVKWFYPATSPVRVPLSPWEGVAGLSMVKEGSTYKVEVCWDGTGEALGASSTAYLFVSVERDFPGKWAMEPALVKGFEGGPFLFWPKVTWDFSPSWAASFQGQFPFGGGSGTLSLNPGRSGISASYQF